MNSHLKKQGKQYIDLNNGDEVFKGHVMRDLLPGDKLDIASGRTITIVQNEKNDNGFTIVTSTG